MITIFLCPAIATSAYYVNIRFRLKYWWCVCVTLFQCMLYFLYLLSFCHVLKCSAVCIWVSAFTKLLHIYGRVCNNNNIISHIVMCWIQNCVLHDVLLYSRHQAVKVTIKCTIIYSWHMNIFSIACVYTYPLYIYRDMWDENEKVKTIPPELSQAQWPKVIRIAFKQDMQSVHISTLVERE